MVISEIILQIVAQVQRVVMMHPPDSTSTHVWFLLEHPEAAGVPTATNIL